MACKYSQELITEVINKHGAFFAFNNEQFNEAKKEGVKYISCGSGLIVPKENKSQFDIDFAEACKKGDEMRLKKEGIDNIIEYELRNHESYYTGDIEDALEALESFNVTRSQVQKVYAKNQHLHQY